MRFHLFPYFKTISKLFIQIHIFPLSVFMSHPVVMLWMVLLVYRTVILVPPNSVVIKYNLTNILR